VPAGAGGPGVRLVCRPASHPTRLCVATLSGKGRGCKRSLGRLDYETAGRDIDDRHGCVVERKQLRRRGAVRPHLDQIAGAEIVDGDNPTETFPSRIDHIEPDEIGMIKLVGMVRLGEALALHVELGFRQPFGGPAVANL